MNKKQINNVIIDLTGLSGIIFQFVDIPCFLKILVTVIFSLATTYYLYNLYKDNKKCNREKRIKEVRKFILNAQKHIVFFGGNLSWAEDYKSAIQQKIGEGCRVDIYYDKNTCCEPTAKKQIENRTNDLRAIKCNVYELDDCYSLRCILSDANNESQKFKGFIIEKAHTDSDPTKNKYKIIPFDFINNHTLAMVFYDLSKIITKSFNRKEESKNA